MFCPQCGKQIPNGSAFCMFCGITIPKVTEESVKALSEAEEDSFSFETDPFGEETDRFSAPSFFPDVEEAFPPFEMDETLDMPTASERLCSICGRLLPDSSISDICVTCLYNRSFVAEELDPIQAQKMFELDLNLDSEYPEEFRDHPQDILESTGNREKTKKSPKPEKPERQAQSEKSAPQEKKSLNLPKRPLLITLALLMVVAALGFGGWKLASFLSGDKPGSGQDSSTSSPPTANGMSNQEKKAVAYAQTLVKAAAANPDTVHFHQTTLEASEQDDTWTVTQSFDRLASSGQAVTSAFTVILTLDRTAADGYVPLMLQVDEKVFYDKRTN